MTKIFNFETLFKKRSVAETKTERVCCSKLTRLVKDVTFDQADAKALQERLALAFASLANIQDAVTTLDDVDMEEESTH